MKLKNVLWLAVFACFSLGFMKSCGTPLYVQLHAVGEAHNSLEILGQKSLLARSLLSYSNTYSVFGLMTRADSIHSRRLHGQNQFVLAANPDSRSIKPEVLHVLATFECGPKVLVLHSYPLSPFSRGLVFAHELVHAQDCLLYHDVPSHFMSRTAFQTEIRAYATELQILYEMKGKELQDLVDEIRSRRAKKEPAQDAAFWVEFFGSQDNFTKKDLQGISRVFPGLSQIDYAFLASELNKEIRVPGFHRLFIRKSQPDTPTTQVLACAIDLLREFAILLNITTAV